MASEEPTAEVRFKTNMLDCFDFIKNLLLNLSSKKLIEVNPIMMEFAGNVLSGYDNHEMIESFIRRSHSYWDRVYDREKSFFQKEAKKIFEGIPGDSIDKFSSMFNSYLLNGKPHLLKEGESLTKEGQLVNKEGQVLHSQIIPYISNEDEEALWSFNHSMVRICIKYIHHKRRPVAVMTQNGPSGQYRVKFFPEINLHQHAKKWNVKLEFLPESK